MAVSRPEPSVEPGTATATADRAGTRWRPLRPADVPAWHRAVVAIDEVDQPEERFGPDDLRDELGSPGTDPEQDSMAAFSADGEVLAFGMSTAREPGTALRRYDLWGAVHPQHRRRGLGRQLLAWQEGRARQRHATGGPDLPGHVGFGGDEGRQDVARLAAAAGFAPSRWYTVLRRPLAGVATDPPPDPPGLRLVPFTPDLDEAVRLAHNDAWLDHWGSYPQTAQRWQTWLVGHRDFRRDWSLVALTDGSDGPAGEVAGYVANSAFTADWQPQGFTEGFTTLIAVRRAWRGRGAASTLLHASAARFAADGMQFAGLDVDAQNPTGALQLYQRLGYRPTRRTVLYGKDLPAPGAG